MAARPVPAGRRRPPQRPGWTGLSGRDIHESVASSHVRLALGLAASPPPSPKPASPSRRSPLGMSVPLSGPSAGHGKELRGGRAYFDQVWLKAGGVNGRKIELVALDDGYETERTWPTPRPSWKPEGLRPRLPLRLDPTTEAMNQAFGPAGVPLVGTISGPDPAPGSRGQPPQPLHVQSAGQLLRRRGREAIASQLVTWA